MDCVRQEHLTPTPSSIRTENGWLLQALHSAIAICIERIMPYISELGSGCNTLGQPEMCEKTWKTTCSGAVGTCIYIYNYNIYICKIICIDHTHLETWFSAWHQSLPVPRHADHPGFALAIVCRLDYVHEWAKSWREARIDKFRYDWISLDTLWNRCNDITQILSNFELFLTLVWGLAPTPLKLAALPSVHTASSCMILLLIKGNGRFKCVSNSWKILQVAF